MATQTKEEEILEKDLDKVNGGWLPKAWDISGVERRPAPKPSEPPFDKPTPRVRKD